jgi:glycine cleavage system T protein (aminomethyltransferase)
MARETLLLDWHQTNGGKMIDYAGWRLPINYSSGIIAKH